MTNVYIINISHNYSYKMHIYIYYVSKQNTPGVKKEQPRTKRALLKKMMGGQGLLLLIALKILIIMTSLQNIAISGALGLLMLMGSKF